MEETNTRPEQSGQEDKEELSLAYADKKEVAKGGVLGLFIGLAIIVPGVSGSAVAIIFRLYEKLLYAFGNLLKSFKKCVRFLLPIAIGAVIGLVVGFIAVEQLINLVMFAVVALFAGLMLGAFPAVTDQIKGEKITAPRQRTYRQIKSHRIKMIRHFVVVRPFPDTADFPYIFECRNAPEHR